MACPPGTDPSYHAPTDFTKRRPPFKFTMRGRYSLSTRSRTTIGSMLRSLTTASAALRSRAAASSRLAAPAVRALRTSSARLADDAAGGDGGL